ncbi:unnamed protein product [Mytilus edulis]|uniref:Uncharacterized protein n=1 Tax=Mytilus edulis TaxID=6550 RepID=A0A8S3TJN7_MYTED|nr:unnamed protein product [Mytilus edulis]
MEVYEVLGTLSQLLFRLLSSTNRMKPNQEENKNGAKKGMIRIKNESEVFDKHRRTFCKNLESETRHESIHQQETKTGQHICETFNIDPKTELLMQINCLAEREKQLESEILKLREREKLLLDHYKSENENLANTVQHLQPYKLENKQMKKTIKMLHENIDELNKMLDEANSKIPIDEKGITQYILESVGIQVFITKGF